MGVQESRELRQLREENGRLKRLVADLSLDRQILQEMVSKSSETSAAMPAGEVGAGGIPDWRASRCAAGETAVEHVAVQEPKG
jgi:putative transposase